MAVRLFSLNGVPEDEAQDVRDLLSDHDIDYFETPAGRWGISAPSLWIKDATQVDYARMLIDSYQLKRRQDAQSHYKQLLQDGHTMSLFSRIKQQPLQFLFYIMFVILILYFSIIPFFHIGKSP